MDIARLLGCVAPRNRVCSKHHFAQGHLFARFSGKAVAQLPDPARLHAASQTFAKVRSGLNAVIFGQEEVIEQTLVTLLAGGHGLLIGVPGLAKTKLVETLAIVLGLDTSRIQFTPDLMPTDITGSEVMEESESGRRSFRFIRGPVFT